MITALPSTFWRNAAQQSSFKLHPIGRILLWVLIIATLEGAVRKWIWPGSAMVFLAIRDILIAYGIMLGISKRWLKMNSPTEALLLLWTVVVIVWGLTQVILGLEPITVAILGLRSWLLYIWFAWLCGRVLRPSDVHYILKTVALIMLPMAVLVVLQHFLPVGHWLNRQPENDDPAKIFTVVAGIVRTTGTFTFVSGYAQFVGLATVPAFAMLAGQFNVIRKPWLRWMIVAATLIGVMVSGSRQTIMYAGAVLIAAVFASFRVKRKGTFSRALTMILVLLFLVGLLATVFSRAIEATETRFVAASHAESLVARVSWMFIGTPETWVDMPWFGNGIGMGNNAAGSLLGRGLNVSFLLAENESDRIMLEGGLLGLAFLLFKGAIVVVGAAGALRVLAFKGDMLPFLLWSFTSVDLLTGQITAQLTAHCFGWLTLALAWALTRDSTTPRARFLRYLRGGRFQKISAEAPTSNLAPVP